MRTVLAGTSVTLSIIMAAGMTGTYFAFSTGVMPGLDAARPASAIDAMKGMNRKIQNPLFIAAFLLVPVAAGAAGALLISLDHTLAGVLFLAAAGVYLLGALLPSFAVSIPMNNALDAAPVPRDEAAAAKAWSDHSGRWTAWNNVRALAGWVSVLAMSAGVYFWGRGG